MADEEALEAGEVLVEGATPPVAAEPAEAAEVAPDYKALHLTAEAERSRISQLLALETVARKAAEARVQGLQKETEATRRRVERLIPEEERAALVAEDKAAEAHTALEAAQAIGQSESAAVGVRILAIGEKMGVNANQAAEFAYARELFQAGRIGSALVAAEQARETWEQAGGADKRAPVRQRQEKLDIAAPPPAANAGASDEAVWARYGQGEIAWSKRVQDAGQHLGYLQ